MTRLALALVFLALVSENQTMYAKLARTPLATVDEILFQPSALKLPLFFFIVVGMLVMGPRKSKDPAVVTMKRALVVSFCTVLACCVYGLATGGVFKQVPWQTYGLFAFSLFGIVLIDAIRTPEHLVALGKVIVAATVWRALAAITFYVVVVRQIADYRKVPAFMTTHDDTTLFCTGVVIVVVYALHARRLRVTLAALAVVAVTIVAIQLNNRRLAWVSLVAGFVVAYFVLPPSPVRRRVNRYALAIAPLLAIYVAVGLGRTERIFKPLAAFDSMDAAKDSSTASREAENDNLIETASHGFLLGTGFGHPFDIVNPTFELDEIFEQWKYLPHNSYLGLLAFTGVLGFTGVWWPLPVCVYLSARGARASKTALTRTATALAVSEVVIYANQAYGDMGLAAQTSLVLLVSACTAAARVASWSGAWSAPAPAKGPPASVEPRVT